MKRISDMMTWKTESSSTRKTKPVIADEKTVFFLTEKVIKELYGVRGSENVTPRYFRSGKLFLSCRNALWANELWMTRDTLCSRINLELGYEGVTDVKTAE
ncbi:MAG TPA: DciA family protein [Candidatus Fimivivens sp.]|nr:DciA family protein [Candidatus Fimivivens sp.]